MKIALALEYDGSRYHGWQSQPNCLSLQDTLEHALTQIACDDSIRVVAAGRTDAGVHALSQVVHFETNTKRPQSAWVRGVNALLPPDISILWACEVDNRFHARYSALERCYLYYLLNRPTRPGLFQHKVGWFHEPLNVDDMQKAADSLLGEHDFSAFRTAECQAKNPVRKLTKLKISQQGDFLKFEFRANGFLHHMVRNIVGSLIYVGANRHQPSWMTEVLESLDRKRAAPTFSPYGLYLAEVKYDTRWNLPTLNDSPCDITALEVFIKKQTNN